MRDDLLTILKPGGNMDHVTVARDRLDGSFVLTFGESSFRLNREAAGAISRFILRHVER